LAAKPVVLARDGHRCRLTGKAALLEVHHVDHDPTNNITPNLVTLSKSAHEFYHALKPEAQAALRRWFQTVTAP